MSKGIKKHPAGSVLMISLLIMGAILAGVTAFAGVSINQVRQARLLTNSVQAYYAAESGAEQALYTLRIDQEDPDCADLCDDLSGGNNGEWEVAAVAADIVELESLSQNESLTVGFLAPYDTNLDSGVSNFQIGWSNDTAWVEVSIFDAGSLSIEPVHKFLYSLPVGGDPVQVASPATGETITVRAVYDDVDDLTIQGCAGGSCDTNLPSPIPGRLTLTSTGSFNNSKQGVEVVVGASPVLSSIFDYVLFSETEITK